MNNVVGFIKSHKKLLALLFIVITIIVFLTNKSKKENIDSTQPHPSSTQASYKTIVPGKSSTEKVFEVLGKPEAEIKQDEKTIFNYKSSSLAQNNQVYFENKDLVLIKEIVTLDDDQNAQDIITNYGKTNKILYGPDSHSGFYLHVYPENGIAYIGHPETGLLLEVWYFTPTTFEEFKQKWASNYTDKLIPQQ
jgi:hypothetical protein